MADLSNKYGPRHPKILDMQAQKTNLGAKINEEVQRVVVSKKNEVEAAQSHVGSLQQSLQQLETQGAGQNKAEVQLTALQSAATSSRSMYEAFLGRLNQSQGREGIQAPDARVISNAEVPASPSYPQTGLVIGLSIPAGLLLGLALAFGAERLDAGFRTTAQLEGLLGVPVLATVPEVLGTEKGVITNATDFILDRPTSSFAEAVRGLQLGIGLSRIDDPPKVIIVTSSVPGEGKTTLAVSLARMAARSGKKTVIVDGDLRRPTLAKVIGGDYQKGIVEVLLDKLPLDQCLGRDPRSNVYVLPCLVAPASPADILASDAMANLVKSLEQCFDIVIIDSAPVLPVNDTKILSRLADAVLFVVRWERTPREATVSAMRALTDAHAVVVGVALSRADSERFRYYSYGYQSYSSYSKYYGE
jgi:capsular exopolysaccharide synthesis family protein